MHFKRFGGAVLPSVITCQLGGFLHVISVEMLVDQFQVNMLQPHVRKVCRYEVHWFRNNCFILNLVLCYYKSSELDAVFSKGGEHIPLKKQNAFLLPSDSHKRSAIYQSIHHFFVFIHFCRKHQCSRSTQVTPVRAQTLLFKSISYMKCAGQLPCSPISTHLPPPIMK